MVFLRSFMQSTIIMVGLACLFFLSCEKEDEINKLSPLGTYTAEATINDSSEWESNRVFGYLSPKRDSVFIILGRYINYHCPIEMVELINIPITLDTIVLKHVKRGTTKYSNQPTAHHSAVDCDATGEVYNLLESEGIDNYLKINEIVKKESDGSITEITGTFKMTLVRDTAIPKIIFPDRPDKLRLTDGTFNAKILESE